MVKLTLLGKIVVAVVVILVVVFVVIPMVFSPALDFELQPKTQTTTEQQSFFPKIEFPSFFPPAQKTGEIKIEVKLFLRANDSVSLEIITILKEISKNTEFQGKFSYELLDVDRNPEIAKKFGITSTPAYIIGNEKYVGLASQEWFENKLRELIQKQ